MTTSISHGTWGPIKENQIDSSSFLKESKGLIGVISLVALGSIVGGCLLLYWNINASLFVFAMGGVFSVSALVFRVYLHCRHKKVINLETVRDDGGRVNSSSTLRVVSWNVGTRRDYLKMRCLYKKMQDQLGQVDSYDESLTAAYNEYRKETNYQGDGFKAEKCNRASLFRQEFIKLGNPDIICLQESWQLKQQDFQEILCDGYTYFTYENSMGKDCTIVWNTNRFTRLSYAKLYYDPNHIPSKNGSPDTIALLKDNVDKTTICVGSAHLRGFSLAFGTLDKEAQEAELTRATLGDKQAEYDLATMDAVNADLYIFAGDFNVTREHYQARLDLIEAHQYVTDLEDISPTIYDANLKEDNGMPKTVRLDHIYAKGREGAQVTVSTLALEATPLDDFNRPSDHIPIGAEITF